MLKYKNEKKGEKMDEINDIFQIPARVCKRCGGILTSRQGLRDGYGHTCEIKTRREEQEREEEAKNQYSLFGCEGGARDGET